MTGNAIEGVSDVAEVWWLVDALSEKATVDSLVPQGFECYARILHPAWNCRMEAGRLLRTPLTWSSVAAIRNRKAHRLMQWSQVNVLPPLEDPVLDALLDAGCTVIDNPDEGTLPIEVASPLGEVLASHSPKPKFCWFGLWEGFGWDYKREIPKTRGVTTARSRHWHVFRAPLKMIESCFFASGHIHQSTNLLWPHNRNWFVATDIDQDSTYIGGSDKLIEDLLHRADLEVYLVNPEDDVSRNADHVNPQPYADGTTVSLTYPP